MHAPRTGQAPPPLGRDEFRLEFRKSFLDPTFSAVAEQIAKIEEVAWQKYKYGHKAPIKTKAGPAFADPGYDMSVEWKATRDVLIDTGKNRRIRRRAHVCCSSVLRRGELVPPDATLARPRPN